MDEKELIEISTTLPPLDVDTTAFDSKKSIFGEYTSPKLDKGQIALLAKNFKKSLDALKELPVPIDNDTSGIPIFTEADIPESINEPDVILRLLFIRYRVTRLRFARQFKKYAVSIICIPEMSINAQRENFLRNIRMGNITWRTFKRVVEVILGLKMTKITIDYVGLDGAKVDVSADTEILRKRNHISDDEEIGKRRRLKVA